MENSIQSMPGASSNVEFEVADSSTDNLINQFFVPEETKQEPVILPKNDKKITSKVDESVTGDTDTDNKINDFLKKEAGDEEDKAESTDNHLDIVYKAFKDNGLIDEIPDFDGSDEKLLEAYNTTIVNRVNEGVEAQIKSLVEDLPEDGRKLLQHLRDGGSVDDFKEVYGDPLKNVNLESVDDQKQIIKTWLTLNGYTPDEVSNELEDYEAIGKTKLKAENYLNKYKAYKQSQIQEHEQSTEQDKVKAQENYKKTVNNIKDIISKKTVKGINLGKEAEGLEDYVLKPSVRLNDGRMVTKYVYDQMQDQPDIEAYLIKAYHSMKRFKLDNIQAAATTRATLDLKSKLADSKKDIKTRTSTAQDSAIDEKKPNLNWENLFNNRVIGGK